MKVLTTIEGKQQYNYLKDFLNYNFSDWEIYNYIQLSDIKNFNNKNQIDIFLLDDETNEFLYILEYLFDFKIYNNIHIIVLTKSHNLDLIKKYIEEGVDSYLKLPLDEFDLYTQLRAAKNIIDNRSAGNKIKQAYFNLKEIQSKLIQTKKLITIGRLASNISHDIYDPLTFLTSNVQILERYMDIYDSVLSCFENCKDFSPNESLKACKKVASIWEDKRIYRIRRYMHIIFRDTKDGLNKISTVVVGLKNFSRINELENENMFNINDSVEATLIVIKNELKEHCKIFFYPKEIQSTFANVGEINQVILSILINANYAITQKYKDQKGKIIISTYEQDNLICCSIKDDGCGMTQEKLNNIFEPNFINHDDDIGTGLSIAYNIIVVKHKGLIEVKSELGEGSEFIIKLPIKTINDKGK